MPSEIVKSCFESPASPCRPPTRTFGSAKIRAVTSKQPVVTPEGGNSIATIPGGEPRAMTRNSSACWRLPMRYRASVVASGPILR